MFLGKRPRHPMKRTTSMNEFTLDLNSTLTSEYQPSDPFTNPFNLNQKPAVTMGYEDQRLLNSVMSPRSNHRRNSADLVGACHFLRACSLCKRRLVPGRDIYMYRGDTAFCSHECRQQQITQDDRIEICSFASKKGASSSATGPEAETIAAV